MMDMRSFFSSDDFLKNWQKTMDFTSFLTTSQQNMAALQNANAVWTQTWQSCVEKQLESFQSSMQESVETAQALSSAQTIEDFMAKQTAYTKKTAEQAQKSGQEIAKIMQSGQTKAMEILSKQTQDTLQAMQKSATQQAQAAAKQASAQSSK